MSASNRDKRKAHFPRPVWVSPPGFAAGGTEAWTVGLLLDWKRNENNSAWSAWRAG